MEIKKFISMALLIRKIEKESLSDYDTLDNRTEEEIERAAANDPDNPPLTDSELKKFRPGYNKEEQLIIRRINLMTDDDLRFLLEKTDEELMRLSQMTDDELKKFMTRKD